MNPGYRSSIFLKIILCQSKILTLTQTKGDADQPDYCYIVICLFCKS